MLVNVCYRVPVVAVVDTRTRRIVRVTVDDESIGPIEYCERTKDCLHLDEWADHAKIAREVAESECWPRWEFGF